MKRRVGAPLCIAAFAGICVRDSQSFPLHLLPGRRTFHQSTLDSGVPKKVYAAPPSANEDDSTGEKLVVLTREDGKNEKLRNALENHPRVAPHRKTMQVVLQDLPCIEHAVGPDIGKLQQLLSVHEKLGAFDYIAVTSPEAAAVFASAWEHAGRPPMLGRIAAVGKATEESLRDLGLPVDFVPSKATAKTLAQELQPKSGQTSLLYPSSAQAKPTLQRGLEDRGFAVTRLNTYDTVAATFSDRQISLAKKASIVCFASPSAVAAWVQNLGGIENTRGKFAVCIGETSAEACREIQWETDKILFPEKPGVDGWANSVADAIATFTD